MEFEVQPKPIDKLVEELAATGVHTNAFARVLLESDHYDPAVAGRFAAEIVDLNDLGFDEPASLPQVYARAQTKA